MCRVGRGVRTGNYFCQLTLSSSYLFLGMSMFDIFAHCSFFSSSAWCLEGYFWGIPGSFDVLGVWEEDWLFL